MIKYMNILAIETSCDETAIAVGKLIKKPPFVQVLSQALYSQVKKHQKYGGVWPSLAKREHQKNLVPLLILALNKAGLLKERKKQLKKIKKEQRLWKILSREKNLFDSFISFLRKYQKPKIGLVAITVGPGLEPCLWTGINFAKAFCHYWQIKCVPVNHLQAHMEVIFLDHPQLLKMGKLVFPALGLIISGGHTQLVLIKKWGSYQLLGETRDDAVGECFDKTARMLNLSYPGGPEIEKLANQFLKKKKETKPFFPRPMIFAKNFDFSFSGLKTAVFYYLKKKKPKPSSYPKIAFEIQKAISDVLIKKTIRAIEKYSIKSILVGGGVIANRYLRQKLEEQIRKIPSVNLYFPSFSHTTDNAIMTLVSAALFLQKKKPLDWQKLKAEPNLKINKTL